MPKVNLLIQEKMSTDILNCSLTANQFEKLSKDGISSLYKLITYLPKELTKLVWLQNYNADSNQQKMYFLAVARLISFDFKAGKRPFFMLKIDVEGSPIRYFNVYYFAHSRYLFKMLKTNDSYFIKLQKNGEFWQVISLKLATAKDKGQASVAKNQFQANYSSLENLSNADIINIHQRLKPADYVLNIVGLIPKSLGLPDHLSLWYIHHPTSPDLYYKAYTDYKKMELFLFATFIRFINTREVNKKAIMSHKDDLFLHQLMDKLPFRLSPSQIQAIQTIYDQVSNY